MAPAPKCNSEDLIGRRFGQLEIIAVVARLRGKKLTVICRCDCGRSKEVGYSNLRTGNAKSCGCKQLSGLVKSNLAKMEDRKLRGPRQTTEGERFRQTWRMMIRRCTVPSAPDFVNYGGRGIRVCQEWLGDAGFKRFFEDMGCRPSPQHTLERIDNSKNYCAENCRWATRKEQNRNRRDNVVLTFRGESHCVAEWAELRGIPAHTIHALRKRGLPVEQILGFSM